MLLGVNRQGGLAPFIETECYQYCPELREQGAGLFRLMDLPARQIETEAEVVDVTYPIVEFTRSRNSLLLKGLETFKSINPKRFTISTRFAFSLE